MQSKLTYNLIELAQVVGRSPAYFRSEGRKRLEAHGFPKPLPGLGLTWSRAAVKAWFASNGEPTGDELKITFSDETTADLEATYATGRS